MLRCEWAKGPLLTPYHDEEWGVPRHDDHTLFELLILEGAQAGLSWETVLRKRKNYRDAFDYFNPEIIASYGENKAKELLANPGIIRNRRKVESAIKNARAFLAVREEFGSFDHYLWRFVKGRPIRNGWKLLGDVPARTPDSDALSKDLQKRGFSFVGSTICYSFMQAVGMVNDHTIECFRYQELEQL